MVTILRVRIQFSLNFIPSTKLVRRMVETAINNESKRGTQQWIGWDGPDHDELTRLQLARTSSPPLSAAIRSMDLAKALKKASCDAA